jgi:branched-chain amino acid transport system ATP-binding protein
MVRTELRLENVSAGYNGVPVIHDISLTIHEGDRLGLIGRNGAGKTTTLATVMGLADCISGSISLGERELRDVSVFRRARAGIGYIPQAREIFPSLTVEENIISAVQGQSVKEALSSAYELFPKLKERRSNGGNQLSGGEQQMLAVARALAGRPKFLLLDEPLEGLAPRIREELMAAIQTMARQLGVGCLLVEQHIDVVLDFATSILVLERGKVVFSGTPDDVRQNLNLLEQSIGLSKV